MHNLGKKNIVSYEFNVYINKCLECRLSYINIEQLRHHLTDVHLKAFAEDLFQFNNEEEFDVWLRNICRASNSEYVRQKTRKTKDFMLYIITVIAVVLFELLIIKTGIELRKVKVHARQVVLVPVLFSLGRKIKQVYVL